MNEILGSKVILNFAFNLRLKSIQMLTMNKLYYKYVILILILTVISIISKAVISMPYSHSLSYYIVAPSVVGFLNSIFEEVGFFNVNETPRHRMQTKKVVCIIHTEKANN